MNHLQLDKINNDTRQFKDEGCIACYCENEATQFLKIVYLNKVGRFCEYHSEDLVTLGLATFIKDIKESPPTKSTKKETQNKGENNEQ
jgi:hypothetical protein